MGLKFVDKGSVVVDCRAAWHNSMQWTLVNNITAERTDCMNGCDAVEKLRDACTSVQEYLDKLRKEGEQKEDNGCRTRVCFVGIEDVPALLNLLDASEHVSKWNAEKNIVLSHGERAIVRIDYSSDRQLLFQEGGKVVFRDEGHEAEKEKQR